MLLPTPPWHPGHFPAVLPWLSSRGHRTNPGGTRRPDQDLNLTPRPAPCGVSAPSLTAVLLSRSTCLMSLSCLLILEYWPPEAPGRGFRDRSRPALPSAAVDVILPGPSVLAACSYFGPFEFNLPATYPFFQVISKNDPKRLLSHDRCPRAQLGLEGSLPPPSSPEPTRMAPLTRLRFNIPEIHLVSGHLVAMEMVVIKHTDL